MSEVIGEGAEFLSSSRMSNNPVSDVGSSDLVEKKPVIHNPLVGSNMDVLSSMCTEVLEHLGDNDSEGGPRIGELYQAIRMGGANFRMAESIVNIGNIQTNIEDEGVCRRSEYYESIKHLGAYFFSVKPAKLQMFDSISYKVHYSIFSALGKDECTGLGSAQYAIEAKVDILQNTEKKTKRRNANWTDWNCSQQRYFNSKCQDIMSETSIKVEDLLTAMLLPRENSSLSSVDMVKLREYLHMGPTSCLVVRFMVMYLMLLRMWHAQQKDMVIKVESLQVEAKKFSTEGISDCLNMSSEDTVVNVVNMSDIEQLIMARSVFGYKCGDFPLGGFDFYMGGFDVPPEVKAKGKVLLLGGNTKLKCSVKITQEDIYNTMVKYAMKMQACSEMEMGFNLAGNIIFSDGLPNFSIPKPQGYVDIIATALSKVNTNGYVPPYHVNELTMLGFLVLSRQQILMVHDMITYAESAEADEPVPVLRAPAETRQALYAKYKNERFSDAFSISSIVDPLLLLNDSQINKVRNVAFPTIAWASVNNDQLVKGTLSEYFWRGEWDDPMDWPYLDATTQKKAKTTFFANGFLIRPITSGIRVRSWGGIEQNAYHIRVQPGKVSTKLIDIECTPKCMDLKKREFKKVPFYKHEFEDEDNMVTVNLAEEDQPDAYQLQEIDSNISVYFPIFGGKVGMHRLAKAENKNDRNKVDPILVTEEIEDDNNEEQPTPSVSKDMAEKTTSTTGLIADTKKMLVETKEEDFATVSDVKLKITKSGHTTINKTHISMCITMFGDYINRKYCKADSVLGRVQHLLGRIAPEAIGINCALRDEFNLSGIAKDGVRKWQLATVMMMPYIPQLRAKGAMNIYKMNKVLALSKNVRHYGTARKRFNLKMLPAYNPDRDLYKAWLLFLREEGFTVTYNNLEMEDVPAFETDDEIDQVTHELIDLTINLRFTGFEKLLAAWKYKMNDYKPFEPMTDDEMKEIKKILCSNCAICMC
nr:MAG: putative capsid protein [Enontekio alphachrysovirus]